MGYPDFVDVIIPESGLPWSCHKDTAKALGLKPASDAAVEKATEKADQAAEKSKP